MSKLYAINFKYAGISNQVKPLLAKKKTLKKNIGASGEIADLDLIL